MLDINLILLIAQEGAVQMSKKILLLKLFELLAIIVVIAGTLGAEEEPVTPARTDRATLLQKGPEGRDPGPRPNHNNVDIILRQMKMLGHAGENRDGLIIAALSQEGRSHTFAKASVRFVANDIDDKVDGIGIDPQTTRDRVKPRLQFR